MGAFLWRQKGATERTLIKLNEERDYGNLDKKRKAS